MSSAATRIATLGLAGLLSCGCTSEAGPHSGRHVGPGAGSSRLTERQTPAGRKVLMPLWIDLGPDKRDRALREVDAAVEAFSREWGGPIEPDFVEVYPFGFEAFPIGDQLAAGWTGGGRVVVAWFRDPPHLRALPHELAHVAIPARSHEEMQAMPKLVSAQIAAKEGQKAVE